MSYLRFVVRRALFALLSVYLVVTATFLLVTATVRLELQSRIARAKHFGADEQEVAALREAFEQRRNLEAPVHERYVRWLVDVTTLDWGYSPVYDQPVIAVLDGRVQTTLWYVLPGVALGIVLGVAVGLFAALDRDGLVDWGARLGVYALLGVPGFMLVVYLGQATGAPVNYRGNTVRLTVLSDQLVAALTVAAGLLAGQVRFARAAALEQTGRAFVKMLRAKGTTRLGLARHVLRNAALPIVSLSVTELLSVLVLTIYVVETVLGIQGLAGASLVAVRESDVALVIWTTMVVVFVGITGNFLKDVVYGYLDPRIRTDDAG